MNERIKELEKQRNEWLKENPPSFLSPDDPRAGAKWALAFPDEADELSDLYESL